MNMTFYQTEPRFSINSTPIFVFIDGSGKKCCPHKNIEGNGESFIIRIDTQVLEHFPSYVPNDLSLKIILITYQPTTQSESPSILLKDTSTGFEKNYCLLIQIDQNFNSI